MPDLANSPSPPFDMLGNPGLEQLFGAGVTFVLFLFIAYAIRHWRRTGSPAGILMLLGGLLTCLTEPFADSVGLLWFPVRNTLFPPLLEGFGVGVPWWVAIGYTWYLGGMPFVVYNAIGKGATKQSLLRLAVAIGISDIVLETVGINMGVYCYYGNQPLKVLGMPWWWAINGATSTIGMGIIFDKVRNELVGFRSLLIIPLLPSLYMMIVAFIAWPIWISLNSNANLIWAHVAALYTVVMTYILFRVYFATIDLRSAER